MSGDPAAVRPSFRLRGPARRSVLLVHILAAGAWLGIDLALGVLVFTALLTTDAQVAGASLQLLSTVAVWPMLTAGLVCMISGAVLGLGSKYGFFRYWWVVVKIAISVVFCALILLALRPGLTEAAETGRLLAAGDTTAEVPNDVLPPALVAPTMLLVAYLLSVFKPWGRVRSGRGRRRPGATAAPAAAAAEPAGIRTGPAGRPGDPARIPADERPPAGTSATGSRPERSRARA